MTIGPLLRKHEIRNSNWAIRFIYGGANLCSPLRGYWKKIGVGS
ncbi:MAG: hypothetical protein QG657_4057 [Acidobacteriota bacterium]|nr:hypothetical protein [Acidobacteriota bacterium]